MSEKLVRTRKSGYCDHQFAHDGRIEVGDVVLVTTNMPSSEVVRAFGATPFSRYRTCSWCLRRKMSSRHERDRTDQQIVAKWFALNGEPLPNDSETGENDD